MYGQASGIGPFANRLELLLHPGQGFCEQDSRFLCRRAAVFLQFGTQGSDRAAAARQGCAVPNLDVYKSAQTLLGGACLTEVLQQVLESRNAQLNDGVANFVLGLEVVVDVAHRNPSFVRNVSNRGTAESI